MAYDFGGFSFMVATVPVENAAGRENRGLEQRGTDDHYTAVQGATVRDPSTQTLTTIAPGSTGGRKDRDYLERGGDDKLAYNPADWRNPTVTFDADGRNDREFVERTTGLSAITGAKADYYDEANNFTGLYPF